MANLEKHRGNFNPYRALRSFDDFFNQGLNQFWGSDGWSDVPPVNIKETESGYEIELSAPGLKKEDFEITLEHNNLKISAGQSTEKTEKKENYLKKEFNYTSFSRSFQLDDEIDFEKIAANYDKGILHLTLNKKTKTPVIQKKIELQ